MTHELEERSTVDLARVFLQPGSSPPPECIRITGSAGVYAWDEFFGANIRNRHTRLVYSRSVRNFLEWTECRAIPVESITPGMVGTYLDQLPGSPPTKKLILAALRKFFDALVLRHVLILNPAASVRSERYEVLEGKTPEISALQARVLLDSICTTTAVGLRDKTILATLIFTAARAGAVAKLLRKDLIEDGSQYLLRIGEKGGKQREIPVRHDLQILLGELLNTAVREASSPLSPLFPTVIGRTETFTNRPMSGTDIWRMVKRRLRDAGLPAHFSPHSFRVATVTDLLTQGVPLGEVQYLAGHADPRTTRLYYAQWMIMLS